MHNFKNVTVIPLLTTIYPEIKKTCCASLRLSSD
mgnify:CR=1 FL=1